MRYGSNKHHYSHGLFLLLFVLFFGVLAFTQYLSAQAQAAANPEIRQAGQVPRYQYQTPWPDLSEPVPIEVVWEQLGVVDTVQLELSGVEGIYHDLTLAVTYENIPAGYDMTLEIVYPAVLDDPQKAVIIEELPLLDLNCNTDTSDYQAAGCTHYFDLGESDGKNTTVAYDLRLMQPYIPPDEWEEGGEGIFSHAQNGWIVVSIDLPVGVDGSYQSSEVSFWLNAPAAEGAAAVTEEVETVTEAAAIVTEVVEAVTEEITPKTTKTPQQGFSVHQYGLWLALLGGLAALLGLIGFGVLLAGLRSPPGKTDIGGLIDLDPAISSKNIEKWIKVYEKEEKQQKTPPGLKYTAPRPGSVNPAHNFPIRVIVQPGSEPLDWDSLRIGSMAAKQIGALEAAVDWDAAPPLKQGQHKPPAHIRDRDGQTAKAAIHFYVDALEPDLLLKLEQDQVEGKPQHRIQSAELRSGLLILKPDQPPVFGPQPCLLKIQVRERPEEHFAGLDPDSIHLTADCEVNGQPAGSNLWRTLCQVDFSDEQEIKGHLPFESLPEGCRTLRLSAADRFDNHSSLELQIKVDCTPPDLELSLDFHDLHQQVTCRNGKTDNQPDIPPTFPRCGARLKLRIAEPPGSGQAYCDAHSGIDPESIILRLTVDGESDSKTIQLERIQFSEQDETLFEGYAVLDEKAETSSHYIGSIQKDGRVQVILSARDQAGNASEATLDFEVDAWMDEGLALVDKHQRVLKKIYLPPEGKRSSPCFVRFQAPAAHTPSTRWRITPSQDSKHGLADVRAILLDLVKEKLDSMDFNFLGVGKEKTWQREWNRQHLQNLGDFEVYRLQYQYFSLKPETFDERKSSGTTLWSVPIIIRRPGKEGRQIYPYEDPKKHLLITAQAGDWLAAPSPSKDSFTINYAAKRGVSGVENIELSPAKAEIISGSAHIKQLSGTLWESDLQDDRDQIKVAYAIKAHAQEQFDQVTLELIQSEQVVQRASTACKATWDTQEEAFHGQSTFTWSAKKRGKIDHFEPLCARLTFTGSSAAICTDEQPVSLPQLEFIQVRPAQEFNPLLDWEQDGWAESIISFSANVQRRVEGAYDKTRLYQERVCEGYQHKVTIEDLRQNANTPRTIDINAFCKERDEPEDYEYHVEWIGYDVISGEIHDEKEWRKKHSGDPSQVRQNMPVAGIVRIKQLATPPAPEKADQADCRLQLGCCTLVQVSPSFEAAQRRIELNRTVKHKPDHGEPQLLKESYVWNISKRINPEGRGSIERDEEAEQVKTGLLRLPDPILNEEQRELGEAVVEASPGTEITFRWDLRGQDPQSKKYAILGCNLNIQLQVTSTGLVKNAQFSLKAKQGNGKEAAQLLLPVCSDSNPVQREFINGGDQRSFIEVICSVKDQRPGSLARLTFEDPCNPLQQHLLAFIKMLYADIENLVAPAITPAESNTLCRAGLGTVPSNHLGQPAPDGEGKISLKKYLEELSRVDKTLAEEIVRRICWYADNSPGLKRLNRLNCGAVLPLKIKPEYIDKSTDYPWKYAEKDTPVTFLTVGSANIKTTHIFVRKLSGKKSCAQRIWRLEINMLGGSFAWVLDVGYAYFHWRAACNSDPTKELLKGSGHIIRVGTAVSGFDLLSGIHTGIIDNVQSDFFPSGLYSGVSMRAANMSFIRAYQQYSGPRLSVWAESSQAGNIKSAASTGAQAIASSVDKATKKYIKNETLEALAGFSDNAYSMPTLSSLAGLGFGGVYVAFNVDDPEETY